MNILMLLTPKKDVRYLTTNLSINQALEILKKYRYNSVPLLDKDGFYIGTVTEGDLLWHISENGIGNADLTLLRDVKRNRDYSPVTINASMDELIKTSLGQNFIPILDDRNYFIGIVTRKDLLNDFISKTLSKEEIVKENPILNVLYKRRSIRKFKDEPIADSMIEEILKLCTFSPTARNKKPLEVFFIDNKDLIREMSELHPKGGQFPNIPYLILVLCDHELENNEYLAISNSGALIMSTLLAIESYENLGGYWIGTPSHEQNKMLLKHLEIPEKYRLYGIVGFGVKDEFKPANEAIALDKIHTNEW